MKTIIPLLWFLAITVGTFAQPETKNPKISENPTSHKNLNSSELFLQNEMAFMYINNGDRVRVTYEENTGSLTQTSSKTGTSGNQAARNAYGTDITSGSYFGEGFGEAAVYAYVSRPASTNNVNFSIDLRNQLGDDPKELTTIDNVHTAGTMRGSPGFGTGTPQIHGVSGNFVGDSKDELFIVFEANDNTIKSQLYDLSVTVDGVNLTATITVNPLDTATTTADATPDSDVLRGLDATALDIDNDGYDELAIVFWKDGEIWVQVFDVDAQQEIQSRYLTKIFDTPSDPECIYGNPDNFSWDWLSLAITGGDYVSDFDGDEIVVGAKFTLNAPFAPSGISNEGLYLFPMREKPGVTPSLLVPNWCAAGSPISVSSSDVALQWPPGLNLASGDINSDPEDELVYATGTELKVLGLAKGTDIGVNTPIVFDGLVASTSISDAQPQSDNFDGPGEYADHFLDVGNIDELIGISNNIKAEIFYGANKYSQTSDFNGTTTSQSYTLSIIGLDAQGQIEPRGELPNLYPVEESGSIDGRRFSLAFVDFDGGGATGYESNNSNYDFSFGLPPLIEVDCTEGTSGFTSTSNILPITIQTVIDTTPFENFHVLPQEIPLRLSLNVTFKPGIVALTKTVKVYHYRTELGTENKELIGIDTFEVAANVESLATNLYFNPLSAATGDALIYTIETSNGDLHAVITPIIVTGADYTVPVLGSTIAPKIPQMVIHDPPGDMSSSTFQQGVEFCRETTQSITDAMGNSTNFALKIGVAGSAGLIVTTDFEFSTTFSVGFEMSKTQIEEATYSECLNVTNSFQTSDLPDGGSIGSSGDVFIGYGERLIYGIEKSYSVNAAECKIDTAVTFAYASDASQAVRFVLTSADIEADIIAQQDLIDNPPQDFDALDSARAENQIEVWNQILSRNENNIATANPIQSSLNFTGGGSGIMNSTEVTTSVISSITYELAIETTAGIETVVEVGGSGSTFGTEFSLTNKRGVGVSTGETITEMISYSLNDNDAGDNFQLDIYNDPDYGTPIFKLVAGSKTSCPYEDGDGSAVIIRRDQPDVSADFNVCAFQSDLKNLYVDNIDHNTTAVFNLQLCNNSNETRDYNIGLYENLNGADVKIANTPLNSGQVYTTETIAANSCKNFILTIGRNSSLPLPEEQGYLPQYDVYDGLVIKMYPSCFGETPTEEDEAIFNVTFGRDGDYSFGDRDCDGILNIDECQLVLNLDASAGELDGTYQAQNQIILKPGAIINAGKTIVLDAPVIDIEGENTIPLTAIVETKKDGCQQD